MRKSCISTSEKAASAGGTGRSVQEKRGHLAQRRGEKKDFVEDRDLLVEAEGPEDCRGDLTKLLVR